MRRTTGRPSILIYSTAQREPSVAALGSKIMISTQLQIKDSLLSAHDLYSLFNYIHATWRHVHRPISLAKAFPVTNVPNIDARIDRDLDHSQSWSVALSFFSLLHVYHVPGICVHLCFCGNEPHSLHQFQ